MNLKRIAALSLSAAIAVTAIGITPLKNEVSAEGNIWDGGKETSIIESKNKNAVSDDAGRTGSGYNGYIQTVENLKFDYFRVVFKTEAAPTATQEIFNFQPFDTAWGGWNNNIITGADCVYDASSDSYSAYILVEDIVNSLSTGGTLKGINLSFCSAKPSVTLVDFLSGVPADAFSAYVKYTIDEDDLAAQNVDWKGATKATVYVKMTNGGAYSQLNAMIKLGPDDNNGTPVGKASSKYLAGRDAERSGNAIQDNLVGSAGTAIYKFPDVNLNKKSQDESVNPWKSEYANYITITVRIDTENTDCELLGIKFNNGAVYKAVDGFNPDTVKTESTTFEEVKTSARDLLKLSLDYCATLDYSKYTDKSAEDIKAAVESAQSVYDNATASSSDLAKARADLEKVKANALFKSTGTPENPLPLRDLTGDELIAEMGAGINLGNTMDGHSGMTPNETSWQCFPTTKEYIKALHDAGFNTLRVPTTWGNMIDTENGYAINANWINRVQEIVDYAVSQDMYVIINVHHDGAEQSGWLRVAADDIDKVYEQYECVWRNIAEHFKDYDEHLIFEAMNEVTCMEGDNKNSAEAIAYDTPIIVNLNQIFVNVVRSTGSNNEKRWLAAVSHYANGGTQNGFVLPVDNYNEGAGKIAFAAHVYKASTNTTWTYDEVYQVVDALKKMANKHKVPLILGEWGTRTYPQDGTATGYNDVARAWFSEIVHRACQTAGAVPVVWDQGYGNPDNPFEKGLYSFWNRQECKPLFETIIHAMMRGTYTDNSAANDKYDFKDVKENPSVTPITSIVVAENVEMVLGEVIVVDYSIDENALNDVVLWSTDDENVVTVSNGRLRAKGIGQTTVYAYSQAGGEKVAINVKVGIDPDSVKAEKIDCDDLSLLTGQTATLSPVVTPVEAGTGLTYKSTNEKVITVNAVGKVFAVSQGTAYVIITAPGGITKTVKVVVTDFEEKQSLDASLHVLYNDSANNYWGCETGTPVTVTGDGEYTVSFDISRDLSKAGENAGITEINKLTAIYIKDIDVTNGNVKSSSIVDAKIRYDKVVINGVEMTVNTDEFLKTMNGTVFDTGKPINAWDGSVIDEVSVTDHTATLTGVDKPVTIEVTFTLKDVKFVEKAPESDKPATSIEAVTDTTVVMDKLNDTAKLTVKLNPADTDSVVSFITADNAVVTADSTAMAVKGDEAVAIALRADNESGTVTAEITSVAKGVTTVTAITDNGLTVEFKIYVQTEPPVEPEPEPSSDEEVSSDEEPVSSDEEPVSSDEEPVSSDEEPVSSDEEPVSSDEEPVSSDEEPVSSDEEPVSSDEEPVSSDEEPVSSDEEPVSSDEEPVSSDEEPVSSDEEPVSSDEEPVSSDEEPASSDEAPSEDESSEAENSDNNIGDTESSIDDTESSIDDTESSIDDNKGDNDNPPTGIMLAGGMSIATLVAVGATMMISAKKKKED